MSFPLIFTAIGMIILVVFLKKRAKGTSAEVTVLKSYVSLGFIAVAVSAIIQNGFTGSDLIYGAMILGGLICGLLGDIWLDLKFAHRESDRTYTYAGMISFMIGHALYICGLFKYYYPMFASKITALDIALLAAIPIATGIFMIFSEKPMKVDYGEFKTVTTIYAMFLASLPTLILTLLRIVSYKNISLILLSAASVLFVISDGILTGTYFGKGKSRPVDIISNHVTYYFAQYLIALSLCFAELI